MLGTEKCLYAFSDTNTAAADGLKCDELHAHVIAVCCLALMGEPHRPFSSSTVLPKKAGKSPRIENRREIRPRLPAAFERLMVAESWRRSMASINVESSSWATSRLWA